jgi:hypothetical protein
MKQYQECNEEKIMNSNNILKYTEDKDVNERSQNRRVIKYSEYLAVKRRMKGTGKSDERK